MSERVITSVIADSPPADGRDWKCQCARCGSSMFSEPCGRCGGEGTTDCGELYEQDPLWYDRDDFEACPECGGSGGTLECCSSYEYCQAYPLEGRDAIPRHKPEWFTNDPLREEAT